ncbi:hypothetical protein M408DRAFT_8603 [Serendipita vermifera MAFF 305830]|uniref:WW domain-containing protein n=1 Tax=Serendipita vermifera MAFF 305830 TaxID=933852 RepID=A0A0C2WRN5_SERVB|nr:hypothetical protein M408DRAFT_8603 [Serendipita vermifera MAFF 305830]
MSYPAYPSPNPSGPPKTNPDTRPLPAGWITQFDTNYNAWFYVDTRAQPPRSEWKHPADLLPPSQPSYMPPGGAPPSSGGSAQAYYQGSPSPYSQQPPYGGGHDGHGGPGGYSPYTANSPYPSNSPYPQQQQSYTSTPAHGSGSNTKGPLGALAGAGAAGGLLGKLLSHGGKSSGGHGGGGHSSSPFGGYGGGGGYMQQPIYGHAAKPKKSNAGRNAMLAGGGGLLGGLLIADAVDDIGDNFEEQAAYEQGFEDGGGDFDGGDF